MIRYLLAALLLTTAHASEYEASYRRHIFAEEARRMRSQENHTREPMRLASDGILRQTARAGDGKALTPAGQWAVKNLNFSSPATVQEANLIGGLAVDMILDAGDRANIPVLRPDGTMLMIESRSVGRAVFYHKDVGFIGMVDLENIPLERSPDYNKTMTRIWESRPVRAPPVIETPQKVFSAPTHDEAILAIKAHAVPLEDQVVLRRKGFLPIDEVAGGTPYYKTDTEGWVKPFTEGAKTFPQTE